MPKQITQFKLLVVTPADVIHEMKIIQETVESLNQMYGMINHADIKIQYWSFDKPNQNFVAFDAVIAVFWTQLGSSDQDQIDRIKTEIEAYLNHTDSFFLYFSACQASPLQIDSDQYRQILKFKSKHVEGIQYQTYSDLENFRRLVMNQLTLYFVAQLKGLQSSLEPKQSDLKIIAVIEDQIVETPKLFRHRFTHSKFVTNYKQKTFDLIHKINTCRLSETDAALKETTNSDSSEVEGSSNAPLMGNENLQKIAHTIRNLPNTHLVKSFLTEPAQIRPEIREVITKYLETVDHKVEIAEFFNLGNLMERLNPLRGVQYGNTASSQLIGSASEKEKYQWLMDLYANIVIYEASYAYLKEVDDLFYLQCAVANVGNGYDEEIEVKLYLDKGYLCRRENLPVPDDGILDIMNPSVDLFFKPRQVDNVAPYNDYPEEAPSANRTSSGDHGLNRRQKAKGKRDIYQKKMETFFCYAYHQEGKFDVLTFSLPVIDPNTQIAFPSYLVFKRAPRRMRYEMRSKHMTEVIQGEMNIIRADR
ncbi:hypothetical protein [Fusibacter ferrireducens]|uniref:Uncharacterized protein n=1 Tax=Fusibacter ferrireducens TaxID=2785058 RepID=A0ABR9ZM37_9FIRM|nr:hypothetical protein [Fusibacter ferrireducens]MBF4691540.1 hypothetical protein [Fusibacter ferrireducens]